MQNSSSQSTQENTVTYAVREARTGYIPPSGQQPNQPQTATNPSNAPNMTNYVSAENIFRDTRGGQPIAGGGGSRTIRANEIVHNLKAGDSN